MGPLVFILVNKLYLIHPISTPYRMRLSVVLQK